LSAPQLLRQNRRGKEATQETQVRGFWIDSSTGLMWAAKDSGKDLSYKGAVKYCRDLRLAGYSDWRLATLGDLSSIYDKTASAPGFLSTRKDPFQFHVKGNLFLTGNPGHTVCGGITAPNMFSTSTREDQTSCRAVSWSSKRPALCVRESAPQGQEATPETQVRGFWTDPSTSLMWAAKRQR